MTPGYDESLKPLAVTYLPLDQIKPDPKNPRQHSAAQIKQIAKSIEAFNFNVPILIDGNNKILAGHGRYLACKKLGWDAAPTIMLAHLTPAQAKAFLIADNKLTDNSIWDDSLLAESLQELAALNLDFTLDATGFSVAEIDLKIEGLSMMSAPSDSDDVVADVPAGPAVSAIGDLWQLGRHRIYCGNALESASYDILMDDEKAAMVFIDPPFNVKINGHCTGLGVNKHREFVMASGEMSEADFTEFLTRACSLLTEHSVSGSIHFVMMDWRHAGELLAAGKQVYHELKNICVWVKDNGGMGSLYRSQHELVFVFKHGNAPHRNNVELGKHGRYRTNVWNYPGANTLSRSKTDENPLALHPTVKPVALIADAIMDCSARGEIILDSFLGSGSTILAAERVGRRCYGIEIDPLYIDIAIRRWQAWSGEDAIHVVTGKSFNALSKVMEAAHV